MVKSRLLGAIGIVAVVGGIVAAPSAQTLARPAFAGVAKAQIVHGVSGNETLKKVLAYLEANV
jgi:hypothetical protein